MKNFLPEKLLLQMLIQHIAILGKTGSGKTYTAKGMAEFLLDKGKRICAIDPTGVWWGLKSKYPVVIFGGEHADFPLTDKHGIVIAEIVAQSDASFIIDTSLMTVGERTRFFTDFAETILRKNRQDLHLIIDEAHNFAPQGKVPDPQAGKMLYATNNLMSMGRARGLAVMLISQRPQKLHKDSLTQAASLIAMRLMHPLDRKAVEDWIGDNADKNEGKEIIKSLPSLETGTGWVWSPEINILEKVKFPIIGTFDSSARNANAKGVTLKAIDHAKVNKLLEETASDIKANDPKVLKARIAELEKMKTILARPTIQATDPKVLEAAENKGWQGGYKQGFETGYNRGYAQGCQDIITSSMKIQAEAIKSPLKGLPKSNVNIVIKAPIKQIEEIPKSIVTKPIPIVSGTNSKISSGECRILTALAQYPQGRTKRQIAMLAQYKIGGGGFNNLLGSLRSKGLMITNGNLSSITDNGVKELGPFDPLPTGEALQEYWIGNVGKAEGLSLKALLDAYPETMTKEQVARAAGYQVNGGGFNNALGKLRTLELIEGRGELKASDDFFQ